MKRILLIPVLLIVSLALAPGVLAQTTYTLEPGDVITHNDEEYQLSELVGEQNCKVYYNGTESDTLVVDDLVGELKVVQINSGSIVLEATQEEETEEEEIGESRYELDSGDIVLFSDTAGIKGAMGYSFGQAMNPTFLFWESGRIPSISTTPVPNEVVTLSEGQTYDPDSIHSLWVTLESASIETVTVVFDTNYSISLMKTTIGETDYAEVIRLWMNEWQASLPDPDVVPTASPAPPVDFTGFYVFLGVFTLMGFVWLYTYLQANWGRF